MAAYSGLRIGELAALRTADVNFLRRTVTVARSVSEAGGHLVVKDPKTSRSRRVVAIPAAVVEELSRHLERFPAPSSGLIFAGELGALLRPNNFRKRQWAEACSAVGVVATPHDLRHAHAAMLIEAGVHPKVIQARLGHASIKTTLDTYGHLFDGLDAKAADGLEADLRRALSAADGIQRESGGMNGG